MNKIDKMRVRLSRVIKMTLMAFLIIFIFANFRMMFTNSSYDNYDQISPDNQKLIQAESTHAKELISKLRLAQQTVTRSATSTNKSVDKVTEFPLIDDKDIAVVKSTILNMNTDQDIYNGEKFKPHLDKNGMVVIIQVHDRVQYLKLLIDSLRTARDISEVLVVFSHDFFSNEINKLIRGIDFCPVIQIFYPYSMQIYPKEFPGEDPNDCPRDIKKDEARKVNCNNAENPDTYGHYREAKFAQTKHHWYWKIHRVYDELRVTKNFTGVAVLLEEDHYVAPDFVSVLRQMYTNRNSLCSDCNIYTLGTYDKVPSFLLSDKVFAHNWLSSKHNMGMSLDREMWENIKKCTDAFCDFDDYNWDWTLQYISAKCLKKKMRAMVVSSPRVFHMGECGVHHKGKNCDPQGRLDNVNKLIADSKARLFPSNLAFAGAVGKSLPGVKPNGGWGDIRDRQLCKSFISDTKQKR